LYIGLLQSAFIVGFCIASPIFAGLVHHYGPFHLVCSGVCVWTFAVIFSGFAYYADSYVMLLFGRILSGVGESSFQCCIPPWIATNSDENTKSRWLAIFNTAIPVGTALGYVYSSLVSTSIGWQWAFFLEAVLIFPFLLFLFFIRTRFPHVKAGVRHFKPVNEKDDEEIVPIPQTGDNEVTVRLSLQDDEASIPLFAREEREDKFEQPWEGQAEDPPNLFEEIRIVCQFPCYIYITLGYAAQTGALIGLSTFGSSFLMGLGYFDSEVRPPQIAS
jgi:MFS transporter, Spinster family, sphingosine-1-phosphate transporter